MTNSNVLTQYQSEVIEALKSAANLGKPFEKVIIDTLKLFMAIPDKINFLQTDKICVEVGKGFCEAPTNCRPKAIDVPADEFHICFTPVIFRLKFSRKA